MSPPPPSSSALDGLLDRLRQLEVADQVDDQLAALRDEVAALAVQLDATTQELESSTAELEAVGAELERSSSELSAVNDELVQRSGDIDRVTGYLQSVIDGTEGAVVVVDLDQKVRAWSSGAAARWGATSAETSGKAFGRLDLKGETPDILVGVRAVIGGEKDAEDVVLADGDTVRCQPLRGADGGLEGAVVFVTPG